MKLTFLTGPSPKSFFDGPLGTTIEAGVACSASNGAFSTQVPAGTYRVLARRYDSSSSFPNATFAVQTGLSLSSGLTNLAWNVTTSQVSGKITVSGSAPHADSSCGSDQVKLSFVSTDGASFEAGVPCSATDGAFSAQVAPGTYRVLARRYDSSSSFPNATFVVDPALQVTATPATLAWNVTTTLVSGKVTADGVVPSASADCSSDQVKLSFIDPRGGAFEAGIACAASDGSFDARVAPGTYRVLARRYDSSSSFPDATFNLVDAIAIP